MKIKHIIAVAAAMLASQLSTQAYDLSRILGSDEMTPREKLAYAERIIESYYVDTVDGDKMVEEAIVAMLKTLDPHSTYSNPEETKELTTPLEGNFSGIGIQFNMLNDTLFVIQTTPGGPSERVGILPGDRILRADTTAISGVKMKNSDIMKVLRGPKDTRVDVEVLRRGVDKPLVFRIVRDDIPLNSIDAAFMADDKTGFIRISRFAETTGQEFDEALAKLEKQGMENLIIDLQDNGGGYLGSAVDVAGNLLKFGDLVTYTEAPKLGTQEYDVRFIGRFTKGKLVVIVNQYSASASEILSGAIQDHDRGLIVGRRTFGKGLVQRPFTFPDGSMMRLTISRYHTPSGRVIQKPYELGEGDAYGQDMMHRYESGEFSSADNISFDNSPAYTTLRNHRTVYGGGGIMPDLFVPIDTTSYTDYYRDLVAKGAINTFAIRYVDDHRAELKKAYPTAQAFIDKFEVTPALIDGIVAVGESEGVARNDEALQTSGRFMSSVLKGLIGRDLFEQNVYYQVVFPLEDPSYKAALELINDDKRYYELLNEQ